jgi:hypothetical protein
VVFAQETGEFVTRGGLRVAAIREFETLRRSPDTGKGIALRVLFVSQHFVDPLIDVESLDPVTAPVMCDELEWLLAVPRLMAFAVKDGPIGAVQDDAA